MTSPARPRRCMVTRGSALETRACAQQLLAGWPAGSILWVDDDAAAAPEGAVVVPARSVHALLGRAFDAVVLSLHADLDPDVLALVAGFAWEGGVLLLRMNAVGVVPAGHVRRMGVDGHAPEEVTTRFIQRVDRFVSTCTNERSTTLPWPGAHVTAGTEEQDRVVAALTAHMVARVPARVSLVAPRGRGKSAALGLALRAAREANPGLRVAVTAPGPDAAAEVMRFAPAGTPFLSLEDAFHHAGALDVLAVDEAAQVPVPVLRNLVDHHERACLAFASTVDGYEGTGRGFLLRFVDELQRGAHGVPALNLRTPIRWPDHDPVENLVRRLLLLDVDAPAVPPPSAPTFMTLDRDALALDEPMLRAWFGLLLSAHHRTTPADLARALDAPNLELHAALARGHVVGACITAVEGGLPLATGQAMASGHHRVKGHALVDTLVSHLGEPEVATWKVVRSVRLAVHPDWRRTGVARGLVEHVHARHADADMVGTVFGATTGLLRFRHACGYQLVRVGVSHGARSGEPAAVMVRPHTGRARDAVERWQAWLARALPDQARLQASSPVTRLDPALLAAFMEGLPAVDGTSADDHAALIRRYAEGVQPVETVAFAIRHMLQQRPRLLEQVDPAAAALLRGRILEGRSWRQLGELHGAGAAAAMRAMRPAVRALLRAMDKDA